MSRTNHGLFNELQEFLGALKLIKIHGEEAGYQHQFQLAMNQLQEQQLEFSTVRTRSQLAFRIGGGVALATLTYAALIWAKLPAARLLVLIALFSRILPQLSGIHMGFQQLWHMLPAFDHWQDWLLKSERARDIPTDDGDAPQRMRLDQHIEFDDVRYQHPHGGQNLSVPHLRIPARQTTAIIGATGSGKTTFLDLLCGLNMPASGHIRVDGGPLTQVSAWRRGIAYVPQDSTILDGTLRDNLIWGHEDIDESSVWQALDRVAAGTFVRQLPQGLETWVGDRGVRLSGGEKQRLALARALLRQPDLLILDEATSALDREHQQIIIESLRQLHGRMTVIIVSHRHEEVRDLLDGWIRIAEGRVGPWQPLMAGAPDSTGDTPNTHPCQTPSPDA